MPYHGSTDSVLNSVERKRQATVMPVGENNESVCSYGSSPYVIVNISLARVTSSPHTPMPNKY